MYNKYANFNQYPDGPFGSLLVKQTFTEAQMITTIAGRPNFWIKKYILKNEFTNVLK